MEQIKASLNDFLVNAFNSLLRIEEDQLSTGPYSNLSVREMHVIETVVNLGEDNTAKKIARELNITRGSLTTAVSTLEKKGMLKRVTDEKDKRVVKIFPTDEAKKAYRHHMKFHDELVEAVTNSMTLQELEIFARGLDKVRRFFDSKREL